ncbi:hypothetical protein BH23ACT6_BH23ACT6_03890 [soil metagenome]
MQLSTDQQRSGSIRFSRIKVADGTAVCGRTRSGSGQQCSAQRPTSAPCGSQPPTRGRLSRASCCRHLGTCDLRKSCRLGPSTLSAAGGRLPDGGPTLRDTSPTLQTWADLLTHVAVTQRELADQRSRLTMVPTLATRDSAAYLERLIDGLANRPMGDPQHIGLVEARELTAALDSLAGDADLLTELEIPDTLQINDVHTGNACGPARPDGPLRIFDLGDSVWSHPFAVLAVPMRMVSETNPTGPSPVASARRRWPGPT